jgi:nitroreductase
MAGATPFTRLLRARHMVRAFTAEPLSEAEVDHLVWAARRAPSAGNAQGTELLVLAGPEQTSRYWDVTLPPERRAAFRWPDLLAAPLLLVPCARSSTYVERYAEDDKAATGLGEGVDRWTVPYWHVDAGMACMAVLLAAADLGLGALLFGLFGHEQAVKDAFGIPDDVQPVATIAVGHPRPGGDERPGRSANRSRRSDDEVVHRGSW